MFSLKPDKDIHVEKIKIITKQRNIPALILRPKYTRQKMPKRMFHLMPHLPDRQIIPICHRLIHLSATKNHFTVKL